MILKGRELRGTAVLVPGRISTVFCDLTRRLFSRKFVAVVVHLSRGDSAALLDIAIAGLQLGNIFVGVQPARGYDLDPA